MNSVLKIGWALIRSWLIEIITHAINWFRDQLKPNSELSQWVDDVIRWLKRLFPKYLKDVPFIHVHLSSNDSIRFTV